jgi:D-glycero-alpha-D-manno-heptose-7-phosphate kinase
MRRGTVGGAHSAAERMSRSGHSAIFRKTRARAPLRLGLAGGGTDLRSYFLLHGGAVLNVTIDRFAFTTILPRDDGRVVFEADDIDVTEVRDEAVAAPACRLALHRGVFDRFMHDFNGGALMPMTIKTTVDAPPGSGLGSSSALVVSITAALTAVMDLPLGSYEIAQLAHSVERDDLQLAGGLQDQYAAAFGGINFIEFLQNDRVIVNPLRVKDAIFNELESSIVVCFSGTSRVSSEIIERQNAGVTAGKSGTLDAMHKLKNDATEMKRALLVGDVDGIAAILNQSWVAKQATASGISSPEIDSLFALALANGALAGKVSGAGGGGFLFFLVHPENRYRLVTALNRAGGVASPIKFTGRGVETWRF